MIGRKRGDAMAPKDVATALQQHNEWVNNQTAGKQADLRGTDLRNVNFEGADLRFVDFRAADLSGCPGTLVGPATCDLHYQFKPFTPGSHTDLVQPLLSPVGMPGHYDAGTPIALLHGTGIPVHVLNHREGNLWYGSYFPDAPQVFETDSTMLSRWRSPQRIRCSIPALTWLRISSYARPSYLFKINWSSCSWF